MTVYIEDVDGNKRRYRRSDGSIAGYVGVITGDEDWVETGGINMIDLEKSAMAAQALQNPQQLLYNLLIATYNFTSLQASEISGYFP